MYVLICIFPALIFGKKIIEAISKTQVIPAMRMDLSITVKKHGDNHITIFTKVNLNYSVILFSKINLDGSGSTLLI